MLNDVLVFNIFLIPCILTVISDSQFEGLLKWIEVNFQTKLVGSQGGPRFFTCFENRILFWASVDTKMVKSRV